MSDPRTLAIPCRADGCPSLVGLVRQPDGAERGTCSSCGATWVLTAFTTAPETSRPPRRHDATPPGSAPDFGPALRAARRAADMGPMRLAMAVGVDRTTIIRLETGNRVPSWSLLCRLLGVLPGLAAALAGEATETAA